MCLRLGVLHPDHLKTALTAGQWLDWVRFDRDHCVRFNRDDLQWALDRADFRNANKERGAADVDWQECDPYRGEAFGFDEELTLEDLKMRAGVGTRLKVG